MFSAATFWTWLHLDVHCALIQRFNLSLAASNIISTKFVPLTLVSDAVRAGLLTGQSSAAGKRKFPNNEDLLDIRIRAIRYL